MLVMDLGIVTMRMITIFLCCDLSCFVSCVCVVLLFPLFCFFFFFLSWSSLNVYVC